MTGQVWTTIDFDKRGIQSDFARVPNSTDSSAYGWVPVPMLCFNGGEGPTVLLTAGTHGDEYEGQIVLRRLARELADTRLRGRVIMLPALNQPAVVAGRRNSPLDGGNLNRVFPGNPRGTVTEQIAHFVEKTLFPLGVYVIDLHSGGSSLDYLPVAFAHRGRNQEQAQRIEALLEHFAAPNTVLTDGRGGGGDTTLYASAAAHGLAALTTELGGGTDLSQRGAAIGEAGVRRVLRHLGVAPELEAPEPESRRELRMLPPETTVYALEDGLFEPLIEVGQVVQAGDVAGYMHQIGSPLTSPAELRVNADGIVIYRRFPVLSKAGDALIGLAAPI
jgi:predicted deacylase